MHSLHSDVNVGQLYFNNRKYFILFLKKTQMSTGGLHISNHRVVDFSTQYAIIKQKYKGAIDYDIKRKNIFVAKARGSFSG